MDDPINHILTSDLSASLQTLCVFVLNNADEDGWCYVSQSEMGEELGVSQSAISRRESKTDLLERDGQRVRVTLEVDSYYESDSTEYDSDSTNYEDKAHSMSESYESDSKDEPDSYPNPYEAAPANTPSRKKKVSTPSKKNSTPPSDTPSLGSVVSGDGSREAAELDVGEGLPEDDTGHPAIKVFLSEAEFYPGEDARQRIIHVVGEVGTEKFSNRMTPWRKTIEEWAERPKWNWSSYDKIIDRFMDKLEAYGLVQRSDYVGGMDLPPEEDKTAAELGIEPLLEEG
jgi:transcriptional regulator with XRE-family HTH domain